MTTQPPPDPASTPESVLAGGGEMGALMRGVDWVATPLGPLEGWPQSLRTAVSVCLESRFPILIWWGEALTMLYNDAYRLILEDKHPAALGAAGEAVWPEIWDTIGPMLRGVSLEGQSTWSEDQMLPLKRRGFAEECYFTFSYSPIRGDGGGVDGVFTAVTETTGKVVGERRLKLLRDLAARTRGAATVEQALRRAAKVLAQSPADLPFAALYLLDAGGEALRLAARVGLEAGSPAAPAALSLDDAAAPWPVARALAEGKAVAVDLGGFPALPSGGWPEAPREALLLPLRRAGQERPYGVMLAGVSGGRPLDADARAFFGLVADQLSAAISDARAREEERARAERLAELDRAKTQFFSNVSHELRTPLTLLLGPLEGLLSEPGDPLSAAQRRELELTHRNARRLLKLVNTLLDFSRIEAGRVQARFRPSDLSALTADLASNFRSLIEGAGLRFVVDTPPLSEPVYLDRDLWEKVVLNLLSNAYKFTFAGEIGVRLEQRGAEVTLSVWDSGVGIPEAELPRLFERFHRIEGQRGRSFEGTGIGLALVRELVGLHGGSITAQSVAGQGSTFRVTLPTGRAHLPPEQVSEEAVPDGEAALTPAFLEEAAQWQSGYQTGHEAAPSAPAVGAERPRLLLADDNADLRAYVSGLLGERYQVEAVADGLAALEAARQHPPDLLLSDVMMPGLDGFELLRALREDERTRPIPIILLSARAGEEARLSGLEAGADDYLVKPFSARELRSRVATHLELSRLRREAARQARERGERLEAQVAERTHELEEERAALDAFVAFTEAVGSETEVAALVRRAIEVARANMGEVSAAYYELEDGLWRARVWSEDMAPEIVEQITAGVPQDAPAFAEAVRTDAPLFADGWDAEGNTLPSTRAYGAAIFLPVGGPARSLMTLGTQEARVWTERERAVARALGRSLNLALERAAQAAALQNQNRELEIRTLALEQANEELEAFTYSVSHDLMTPVRHIVSFAQLTRQSLPEPPKAERFLTIIEQAARRMNTLIEAMLQLSRLGRRDLRLGQVDLAALVRQVLLDLEPDVQGREVVWRVGSLPTVRGDRDTLQQALGNLIGNALKYSGGRERAVIEVWGQETAQGAEVFVRDNGVGFDPRYTDKLFGLFQRLHRQEEFAGTGVGLANVRRIVARHGGTVFAQGRPGEGATFGFTLPRVE